MLPTLYFSPSELHSDTKRQGLIPFPRVGRSMSLEPQMGQGTRWGANGDVGGGMWFGPRLGRLSKRNGLNGLNGLSEYAPWTMIALRGNKIQSLYILFRQSLSKLFGQS